MGMISTILNFVLAFHVFASTVDSKPVAMDQPELDTSVLPPFCTVTLYDVSEKMVCPDDRRYSVKWVEMNRKDNTIGVSYTNGDSGVDVETNPEEVECRVDASEKSTMACGDLCYISWFYISDREDSERGNTKIIQVRVWHAADPATA